MQILSTIRLLLRPVGPKDALAFEAVFCDQEVMKYSEGVQSPSWVKSWLNQAQAQSDLGVWAVVRQLDNQVIGYGSLTARSEPEKAIEIGYRFARAYWNQGYAFEATQALKQHALNELGFTRLMAQIDPANRASIQLAQKLGMRFENELMLPHYSHPDHLYRLDIS